MCLLKSCTRHRGLPYSQQCEAVSLCVRQTESQYFAWLPRQRGPSGALARQWCGLASVHLFLTHTGRLFVAARGEARPCGRVVWSLFLPGYAGSTGPVAR